MSKRTHLLDSISNHSCFLGNSLKVNSSAESLNILHFIFHHNVLFPFFFLMRIFSEKIRITHLHIVCSTYVYTKSLKPLFILKFVHTG